jgi:hypothetical protein
VGVPRESLTVASNSRPSLSIAGIFNVLPVGAADRSSSPCLGGGLAL